MQPEKRGQWREGYVQAFPVSVGDFVAHSPLFVMERVRSGEWSLAGCGCSEDRVAGLLTRMIRQGWHLTVRLSGSLALDTEVANLDEAFDTICACIQQERLF